MTKKSGARDSSHYDGNAIPLYHFEYEIDKLTTQDKILDYMSNIGNNMLPCAIAITDEKSYILVDHSTLVDNKKVAGGTF